MCQHFFNHNFIFTSLYEKIENTLRKNAKSPLYREGRYKESGYIESNSIQIN